MYGTVVWDQKRTFDPLEMELWHHGFCDITLGSLKEQEALKCLTISPALLYSFNLHVLYTEIEHFAMSDLEIDVTMKNKLVIIK